MTHDPLPQPPLRYTVAGTGLDTRVERPTGLSACAHYIASSCPNAGAMTVETPQHRLEVIRTLDGWVVADPSKPLQDDHALAPSHEPVVATVLRSLLAAWNREMGDVR